MRGEIGREYSGGHRGCQWAFTESITTLRRVTRMLGEVQATGQPKGYWCHLAERDYGSIAWPPISGA